MYRLHLHSPLYLCMRGSVEFVWPFWTTPFPSHPPPQKKPKKLGILVPNSTSSKTTQSKTSAATPSPHILAVCAPCTFVREEVPYLLDHSGQQARLQAMVRHVDHQGSQALKQRSGPLITAACRCVIGTGGWQKKPVLADDQQGTQNHTSTYFHSLNQNTHKCFSSPSHWVLQPPAPWIRTPTHPSLLLPTDPPAPWIRTPTHPFLILPTTAPLPESEHPHTLLLSFPLPSLNQNTHTHFSSPSHYPPWIRTPTHPSLLPIEPTPTPSLNQDTHIPLSFPSHWTHTHPLPESEHPHTLFFPLHSPPPPPPNQNTHTPFSSPSHWTHPHPKSEHPHTHHLSFPLTPPHPEWEHPHTLLSFPMTPPGPCVCSNSTHLDELGQSEVVVLHHQGLQQSTVQLTDHGAQHRRQRGEGRPHVGTATCPHCAVLRQHTALLL